ncbi:MAG: hypothetical protein GY760_24030, partial [Deltaproteobacteria bacterium]|nr:hypothetical protein [Deltaproteobacteria bacterium]
SKELDTETGLYYYGARYYDPRTSVWQSADPIMDDYLDGYPNNGVYLSDNLNLYAYTYQNPVIYTDPDGNSTGGHGETKILLGADGKYRILEGGTKYRNPLEILVGEAILNNDWSEVNATLKKAKAEDDNFYWVSYTIRVAITRYLGSDKDRKRLVLLALGLTPLTARTRNALPIRRSLKKVKKVKITKPYERPNNATTKKQRESVQGKPCVTCGKKGGKRYADHKEPLVKEYYRTGKINKKKMKSKKAVQPQCKNCSDKQGGKMRKYSRQQRKKHGL